jgi:flagellar secretion chaperone FliS
MFRPANPAHAYRHVGVTTDVASASPHRLVHLLYDAALTAVRTARKHMAHGHLSDKGMALTKAIRIVDEGLKASLDHARGGELSARLANLYDYISRRLVTAGHANDAKGLDEVEKLLATLQEAWDAIEPPAPRPLGARAAPYGSLVAA